MKRYKYIYRWQQNDNGVGAGIAIFIKGKLEQQLKYRLRNNCSNNQAEQMATVKAIEAIENIYKDSRRRKATIYTDSRVTIQSLKNHRNHKNLIEAIRKKAIALEREEWTIKFKWIKVHVENQRNDIADNLAKEATKKKEITYNKIPKSQIAQVKQQSIEKWQTQWKKQQKGLQQNSFSQTKERLKKKTQVNTKLHSNSNTPWENQRLLAQI